MNTTDEDRFQEELRLLQLENKLLREKLLRAAEEARQVREQLAELNKRLAKEESAAPFAEISGFRDSMPATTAPDHGSCVLYIEDNELNFQLVERILEERPEIELLWGETGSKGLQLARQRNPHLVLLDLDLPDMHGRDVLRSLQSEASTAKIPVVVISADATPSQIERMLAAGARNYLTKPFEIRRFLYTLDEVFAQG